VASGRSGIRASQFEHAAGEDAIPGTGSHGRGEGLSTLILRREQPVPALSRSAPVSPQVTRLQHDFADALGYSPRSRAVEPLTWWPRTRRPHRPGESVVLVNSAALSDVATAQTSSAGTCRVDAPRSFQRRDMSLLLCRPSARSAAFVGGRPSRALVVAGPHSNDGVEHAVVRAAVPLTTPSFARRCR
jgi:hypothetical protein